MEWREDDGVLYANGYYILEKNGNWEWGFGEYELGNCHSQDEAKAAAERDNQDEDREYERDYEIQFTVKNSFIQWRACPPKEALVQRFQDLVDDVAESGIEGLGEVVDARIWDSFKQKWVIADKKTLAAINGIREGTSSAFADALQKLAEKVQQESKGSSEERPDGSRD